MSDLFHGGCLTERLSTAPRVPTQVCGMPDRAARPSSFGSWDHAPMPLFASAQRHLFNRGAWPERKVVAAASRGAAVAAHSSPPQVLALSGE